MLGIERKPLKRHQIAAVSGNHMHRIPFVADNIRFLGWHALCFISAVEVDFSTTAEIDMNLENLRQAAMKLLENPFGIHEQAIKVRNQRLELIAANIANADTPHFKARDLDFKQVLSSTVPSPMASTDQRHFETGEVENPGGLVYRVPYNTSVDGNTVEVQVEQAAYGEAAAEYQATLQFLEKRISGIRKALKGE